MKYNDHCMVIDAHILHVHIYTLPALQLHMQNKIEISIKQGQLFVVPNPPILLNFVTHYTFITYTCLYRYPVIVFVSK